MTSSARFQIAPEDLSPEALRNVLEELVTRDGTEFSEAEAKAEQALAALERGRAELWFDQGTKTFSLVPVR